MGFEALMARVAEIRTPQDETHARLLNWGRWLRYDSTFAKLGYPSQSPFVFNHRRGKLIADLDAEHVEWVVSSLNISGLAKGALFAFILRVEYVERPDSAMPHVSQRADDVRKRFQQPCGERTYYYHLHNAKRAISMLAGPMK